MKFLLLLAVVLAVLLAEPHQTRAGSSQKKQPRPRDPNKRDADWSGENFWPWMMYWGNRGNFGNYGGNAGGYSAGGLGGGYGGNQGGQYGGGNSGGRARPYSGNSGFGYSGSSWGNNPWYGGWWGGNNWSGEFFDRSGLTAPPNSRRSASGVRPTGRATGRSRV